MPIAVPRRATIALVLLAALALTAMLVSGAEAATSGQLKIGGYNGYGEIGNGSVEEVTLPITLSGFSPTVTAAAGSYYDTYALLASGQLEGWGYNYYGEVGDGTTEERHTPTTVKLPSSATAVSAGYEFAMALLSDGTVATWGYGIYGELGDGTDEQHLTPIVVPTVEHIVSIAAGCYFGMALRSDGRVEEWGYGGYGELGDGTGAEHSAPIVVPGIEHVVAIAANCYNSYVLLANGEVKAWGYNQYGELGDGTKTERKSPVSISGPSNITSIAAGYYFAIALHADGTLSGWGYNGDSELGDGTTEERLKPVALPKWPSNITSISTAVYDTYAILANGEAYGAGYNSDYELGDGTNKEHSTPEALTPFLPGVVAFGHGFYTYDLLAIQGAFANLSSSSLAFPNQQAGTASATQSVSLTNKGPAPLIVSGVALTGAGAGSFTKVTDGCQGTTLAAGASCAIGVVFSPGAAGAASATLAVSSTAANSLPTVALSGTATAPPPPAPTAPLLGSLSFSHSSFRAASSGPSAIAASAIGTLISYSDSKPATTTFTVQKPVVGVISGSGRSKHCGAMPKHPKKGAKHCKLYKSLGSFSHVDIVGVNKLKFTGRLHGRKLPAGSYRLVAKAAAAGLTSATQTKSFKIVH